MVRPGKGGAWQRSGMVGYGMVRLDAELVELEVSNYAAMPKQQTGR